MHLLSHSCHRLGLRSRLSHLRARSSTHHPARHRRSSRCKMTMQVAPTRLIMPRMLMMPRCSGPYSATYLSLTLASTSMLTADFDLDFDLDDRDNRQLVI